MRLHFTLLLADLLLALAGTAAPVPKRPPPPPALTADQIVGTWAYEWGSWPDGTITFNADGTYTAVHVPGSNTVYFGSWTLQDDAVTLGEYSHNLANNWRAGPAEFKYQFAAKDYPKLSGLSNGTTKVALANPKK